MNVIQQLETMASDLRGTPYEVRFTSIPGLLHSLKQLCYQASPDLSDPHARDLHADIKRYADDSHKSSDIDALLSHLYTLTEIQ